MTGRVLFAWERGKAYGHLVRDLPVALSLRERGADVSFVVRDPQVARELLGPHCIPFFSAPVRETRAYPDRPAGTYVEMLYRHGYSEFDALLALTTAWVDLLGFVRPTVVVANYAPTAMLAARIRGIALFLTGSGWEIPPAGTPSPWLGLAPEPDAKDRWARELEIDSRINMVLQAFGSQPIEGAGALFHDQPTALTTFPELDHFGRYLTRKGAGRDPDHYVGPIGGRGIFRSTGWARLRGRVNVLAYVRPSASLEPLLASFKQLSETRADILCVLPGVQPRHRAIAGPRVRILGHGVELAPLLRETDVFVGYGGAGAVADSLLAGVPLMLMPDTLERAVTADRVTVLGAGEVIGDGDDAEAITARIAALVDRKSAKSAARAFADRYSGYDQRMAVERIVTSVGTLL